MTNTNVIYAKKLALKPLDCQIKEHGGSGFNASVTVTAVEGSYSCLYQFDTIDGPKQLLTPNQVEVGVIDCENNYGVVFYPDSGEYRLEQVKKIAKPPYKILLSKHLGYSFEQAIIELKKLWPNRIVWKLTKPELDFSGKM